MKIYRLGPIDDHVDDDDPRWTATELKEGCWVLARDEEHARLVVEMATMKMVDMKLGHAAPLSPWRNPKLTTCEPDEPGLEMREGIVVSIGGRTYS